MLNLKQLLYINNLNVLNHHLPSINDKKALLERQSFYFIFYIYIYLGNRTQRPAILASKNSSVLRKKFTMVEKTVTQ